MSAILFCDIDGTLAVGREMSERIKPALERFVAAGNYFSLSTGRNAFAMKWLCEELPVNAPCIILAGAALYDPASDSIEKAKPLPAYTKDRLKLIYDAYPDMSIQVFTDAGLTSLRLGEFLLKHGIPEERALGVRPIEDLEGRTILKIGLFNEDVSRIGEAIERFLGEKDVYSWHMSFVTAAEVCDPSASKGVSMEDILSGFGVRPDVIAVAGDSPNDLPMFPLADVIFVPEDGFPEVKAKADHIIPTAREGGVADALEILMDKYS